MRSLLMIPLCIAVVSCASPGPLGADGQRATVGRAEVGSPFDVRVGEEVVVGETGLRIRFDSVRQDSRCPSDVQCVWAGDAEIVLRLITATASPEVVLHTNLEPRAANAAGHLVRVEGLRPTPTSERPIAQADHVVTLVVSAPRAGRQD